MRGEGEGLYPHLLAYTNYVNIYESIDIVAMFGELEILEEKIKAALFTTQDQKELASLKKEALILKDLFSISLTNGRLQYLLDNIDTFKASLLTG